MYFEKNCGLMANLNGVFNNVNSDYFIRNDGDDYSLPSRFENLVSFMEANKDIAVLGSAFYHLNYTDEIFRKIQAPTNPMICRLLLHYMSPLNIGTAIWRVSALKSIGGFKHTSNKIEGFTTLRSIVKTEEFVIFQRHVFIIME